MQSIGVTPFAGVWIEIEHTGCAQITVAVTPFAGVWIEILFKVSELWVCAVTPFAGVWIEILILCNFTPIFLSLPSRECGLKYDLDRETPQCQIVTPFAGVWIEISLQ